ncbi:MAG: LemA family protein [bacterium]
MPILFLFLLFVLVFFGYFFYAYNRLTQLYNTADTEWAQIDVLLKKRADLIPNLIEVVKGYASHEKEVLEKVSYARAEAMSVEKGRGLKETDLSNHIAGIFALREKYPNLKASDGFLQLQKELFEIEDAIGKRRNNYNDVVKAYNDFILKFPGSMVAGSMGFKFLQVFEFTDSRDVIKVSFNDSKEWPDSTDELIKL